MRCIVLLSLFAIGCSTNNLQDDANADTGVEVDSSTGADAGFDAQSDSPIDPNIPDAGCKSNAECGSHVCYDGRCQAPTHTDGVKNGDETDIDCGGSSPKKCTVKQSCLNHNDCLSNACRYDRVCVGEPSCINHFGGDTCGSGEVGEASAKHESCCKSLLVQGYSDSAHPGKLVYVDKYEITAGRVRAFVQSITNQMAGKPNIQNWIVPNRPKFWNTGWEQFLPSDAEGGHITINRLLLGDPRHDGEANPGPGVIVPPPTDQVVNLGINHQFGAQVFADTHGNNCGLFPGAYGFPTFYYPASVLVANGEEPRQDAIGYVGEAIPPQEFLDVKSMNCITNVMLAAFCAWDGGQLATIDVMNFITASSTNSDAVSGCGTQYDNHGALLGNNFSSTVQTGGRCAPVIEINATFDAGDNLPVPGSLLNQHNYHYPDIGNTTSDKVWQIAAPGRVTNDKVSINPGDEPWMDVGGNLSESVLNNQTGRFGVRFRGIGYGSSRSDLNVTLMPGETILRVQRPEVKSALTGGRCMRFK